MFVVIGKVPNVLYALLKRRRMDLTREETERKTELMSKAKMFVAMVEIAGSI